MNFPRSLAVALLAALISFPALAQPLEAGDDLSWCKAHPAGLAMAVARHQKLERQTQRESALAKHSGLAKSAPKVYRYEQIAVIEDDGSLIIPPQAFDLAGRSLQFLRRPKGMSVVRSNLGMKALIGDRLDLNDDDAVLVDFPAGFEFPFFDQVQTSVYVSSNGQLTFGEPAYNAYPDGGDLLFGAPRIAPLLTNLNPTYDATDRTGVYVRFLNKRVRFTWLELPWEAASHGTERLVTMQATLFDNGRIAFAYGDVAAETGIVGVFPGGIDEGDFDLVDFSAELPRPPRQAAVFELFLDQESLNAVALAQTFYRHFEDRYDQLILWLERDLGTGRDAITLQNDIEGIGMPIGDLAHVFGSERLQNVAVMGSLHDYPDDPTEPMAGTYSTMGVIAHEVGHRWMGALRFIDGNGLPSLDLMDVHLDHWSFYVDSDGSYMDGTDIQELGNGVFETVDATSRCWRMDQYLMGLIPPEEVPGFFYVDNAQGPGSDASPRVGVTLRGDRVDLTVWDVIAAEGPRVPSAAEAPKTFNMAFVLLARAGEPPSVASLEKLDYFRRYWHRAFREATDGHGRVNTSLRLK